MTNENLRCYLAPLEGVTNYAFRNTYGEVFGEAAPMDKYFTPFINPAQERALRTKEKKDVDPQNNQGLPVIPQILTAKPELFVQLTRELEQLGYDEVNLNVGCPSGTVTNKGRGAGMLREPDQLEHFLEEIFRDCPIRISVKTRVGYENPEEFGRLMEIFNQYPMEELIVHPRVRQDYYQNQPHMEAFDIAYETGKMPLVYNGDLFTVSDIQRIREKYPKLRGVMLGRGLISNPGLWGMYLAAEASGAEGAGLQTMTPQQLEDFQRLLYERQVPALGGENLAMRHMKEAWFYMIHCFREPERYWRKLRKIRDVDDYQIWVRQIFREGEFDLTDGFQPPVK